MSLEFKIEKKVTDRKWGTQLRAARIQFKGFNGSAGGFEVLTPTFMPVGTAGSVKGVTPEELRKMKAQIILGNTYHLYLRPGHERIERFGGLPRFNAWDAPMLTDSGGFQVFSLSSLNTVDDQGVTFQSHLDGSSHRFTPEHSMQVQRALGAHIVMAFDQCAPYPAKKEFVIAAQKRTYDWAVRGLKVPLKEHQCRFGIIQGGLYEDLRIESSQEICSLPFDGFAIGGLAIGETMDQMQAMTRFTAALMPEQKPRYLMGVGRPEDIVEGIRAGVDLFDCVMPTRNARNGQLFTSTGKVNIKNSRYADSSLPLDPECPCEACTVYTLGYLRHLFVSKELLSARLNSIHNLTFYLRLVSQIRESILEDRFDDFVENFYRKRSLIMG